MGFGKDGKGNILYDVKTITLGALAAADVISATAHNLAEDFRIIKTEYYMSFLPGSFDALEGPIVIGLASAGLTDAEIEECIECDVQDSNDFPDIEQALRPVFPLEILTQQGDGTNPVHGTWTVKGEKVVRWTFVNDAGFKFWAYNLSGNALTTGGLVYIFAKHYGVWVR